MEYFLGEVRKAIKFIAVLCLITIAIQILHDNDINLPNIGRWIFSNVYFGIPFYFANAYLNEWLNGLFPWHEEPKKRVLWGIPSFIVMNVGILMILLYVFSRFYLGNDSVNIFSRDYINTFIVSLTICLIATLYFHAVGFFNGFISQMRISEKLKEEKISAELNALKSQVNPHFLFNSFNVLSGLIDEDSERAQKFLGGLSKIYRYILEQRNEDLSSVKEELAFANQYLKLQKTRFEDGVNINIAVPQDAMGNKIPSLSLQLLLENAIKHNAFDDNNPLQINIAKVENNLVVSNNVKERSRLSESNGIGLENIAKRYELHAVPGFHFVNDNNYFKVTLPLI